ncbi:MAG: SH3 domain-containing protein [Archangium sp.]|nr:SH3 domain-containing protein [Archangium sp.]
MLGCAGTAGQTAADGELLEGAEEYGTLSSELSTGVPLGSTLKTTANLNLRTSASMSGTIRLVIPSGATVTTVNVTQPNGGWYNIKYNGVTGWSYGTYLNLVSSPNPNPNPNPTPTGVRDEAIARARGAVGFSYWWGHGRWIPNGVTSSNAGTCTGSCPNCSHGGSYGADCSGLAAKVWNVPSSNNVMTTDSHPYGTIHFVGSNALWSTISRSNVQKGDALVYNTNGAGHIFIYESGDGWGSMWAYEAKGCAYGIVHNLRTATSAFKAIKRAGW